MAFAKVSDESFSDSYQNLIWESSSNMENLPFKT